MKKTQSLKNRALSIASGIKQLIKYHGKTESGAKSRRLKQIEKGILKVKE